MSGFPHCTGRYRPVPVSSRRVIVVVPDSLELYMYARISDPEMRPHPPRLPLASRTPANSNQPMGSGFPHRAGRYRPRQSSFSSSGSFRDGPPQNERYFSLYGHLSEICFIRRSCYNMSAASGKVGNPPSLAPTRQPIPEPADVQLTFSDSNTLAIETIPSIAM